MKVVMIWGRRGEEARKALGKPKGGERSAAD